MRVSLVLLLLAAPAVADGPKDNLPDNVRPIPPKGSPVPDADRKELEAGLADLGVAVAELAKSRDPQVADLLPDVEVFHKAVRYALQYDELYVEKKGRDDIAVSKRLLKQGLQRAAELKAGKPSWVHQTGLVVRGYRSKIDGSVQPYGLVVPASYTPTTPHNFRLDVWWHGRGETLTEVNFLDGRQRQVGEFAPRNAFVLHPYGRYCNANKFAGEVDTFEALDHVKKHYPIDENRLVARGFSMGGAACWQFATHFPTFWCAAAPGAGFAETPEFLGNFQNEQVKPTWWEERLWGLYNATDYAVNLYNLPTVAYSGEKDRQKQAADVMARELAKHKIELTHIIGWGAGHNYTPAAKVEINRRIDRLAAGRDAVPSVIHFTTPTVRYNRSGWVRVDSLERHWRPGTVLASRQHLHPTGGNAARGIAVETSGVVGLTLEFDPGQSPDVLLDQATIDKQAVPAPERRSDGSAVGRYRKIDGTWKRVAGGPESAAISLKRHGLQGPIDDAFMDRFLMVRPTGKPLAEKTGAWAAKEMQHAVTHWRQQFRGDAPVKDDTAVTDDDIRNANLILWGDPQSNKLIARVLDRLPVKWTAAGVEFGGQTYPADTHVPVLIFPNPLNPQRYVVLNSGFTFREYDYLNNARQVPKLPDYAILDVTTPPNSRWPGKVVRAGFFGEKWELLPDDGK
ncbi:MAG: prolyl oligopeptidase family serine peptidase [Gemmataceae bacterium]